MFQVYHNIYTIVQSPNFTISPCYHKAPKNVLIFYNCLHVPPTVFWLCYLLFKSLSKRTENVLNLSWNVHIFLKDTDSFPRSIQTFLKYPQFAKKSPSYQNVQSFPKSPLSENIWTIFLKVFIFFIIFPFFPVPSTLPNSSTLFQGIAIFLKCPHFFFFLKKERSQMSASLKYLSKNSTFAKYFKDLKNAHWNVH